MRDSEFWFRQRREQEAAEERRRIGLRLLELIESPKNTAEKILRDDLVHAIRKQVIDPREQGGTG